MAITFLLLTLLVQVATAMTARSAADAATAASARRVVVAETTANDETLMLTQEITALVPGAEHVTASVHVTARSVVATARFKWKPPGPVLATMWISTRTEVPRVLEP